MDGKSKDLTREYIEQIKGLFPEAVTEVADKEGNNISHKVDMEKLAILLGEAAIPADETEYRQKYGEKFSFEWAGKRRAIAEAQKRSTGTLLPCPAESVDWDNTENLYIEGDNLEVLKLLQDSYLGAVKMIYIDPPYNTGKDFVYKDDYRDNLSNYIEMTNTTNAVNSEASGRYHTNWLNMMYPRLKLARNLLTDDGVIFISIDDNEVSNLKAVCDEVFGEDNSCGLISRIMKSGGAKGRFFSPNIEYILVYAKNIATLNCFREGISEEVVNKLYTSIEIEGEKKGQKYRPFGLYQSSLDARPNQRYYIECPDGSFVIPPGETMPIDNYDGSMILPNSTDGCWRWSRDRYLEEKEKGNIAFKKSDGVLIDSKGNPAKWNIYSKIWLSDREEDGMVPVNLISKWENRLATKELTALEIPFDFAKPSDLVKYLISIIGDTSNTTILDFFSGSATTAHAVMQLNAEDGGTRKYICVQLPESTPDDSEARKAGFNTIPEIAKERIRRAGKKILDEQKAKNDGLFAEDAPKLDIGFKVFKLDRSNVKEWDVEFDGLNEKQAAEALSLEFSKAMDILKDGRSELDLLYEVMLKLGLQLSTKVETKEIDGKTVFVVGHGVMIASFAKGLSSAQIGRMLDLKADFIQASEFKVVLSDESFASDNDKTNVMQLFKQRGITNYEII